jgi:hypothetical protein
MKMAKRSITIIGVVLVYVFGISYALMYLPFNETPDWLVSLFNRRMYGALLWLKIRQLLVVTLISYCLAWFLVRHERKNARMNSIAVGALSVLWSVGFAWVVVGSIYLSWIEITDYLVIGLGIPLWTTVISKRHLCEKKASNLPLELSR